MTLTAPLLLALDATTGASVTQSPTTVVAATSSAWWVDLLTTLTGTLFGAALAFGIAYFVLRRERRDATQGLRQSLAVVLHAAYRELRENANTIAEIREYYQRHGTAGLSDLDLIVQATQDISRDHYGVLLASPGYPRLPREVILELFASYELCMDVRSTASIELIRFRNAKPADLETQVACWTRVSQSVSTAQAHLQGGDGWEGSVAMIFNQTRELEVAAGLVSSD